MDLDERPANASLVRFLEAGAHPAHSDVSLRDARLDGWELRCHPDLRERLEQVAEPIGLQVDHVRGVPVLIHPNGVAFAAARGTSLVLLRLPPDECADVQRSRWTGDAPDADWVAVEPWLDLPDPEPRQRLSEWVARAFAHAASL